MNQYEYIDRLDLSVRSRNCLLRAGVVLVYDLMHVSEKSLSSIRNIKAENVLEVTTFMNSNHTELFLSDKPWPSAIEKSEYVKNHVPNPMFVSACKNNKQFRKDIHTCVNEVRCVYEFSESDVNALINECVSYSVSIYEMLLERKIISYLDINAIAARAYYLFFSKCRTALGLASEI